MINAMLYTHRKMHFHNIKKVFMKVKESNVSMKIVVKNSFLSKHISSMLKEIMRIFLSIVLNVILKQPINTI